MITLVSIIFGVILIIALGFLGIAIAQSPEGYEDTSGFHYSLSQANAV